MTDKSVVPEGMVAWAGGDCAPVDWDRAGRVVFRNGNSITRFEPDAIPTWRHSGWGGDIIAYTPKPNPLSLETSDLDPITPEEDALATAILAAVGRTRQSHDTVVRAIRDGLAKAGAVIVPVEPTAQMVAAGEKAAWDDQNHMPAFSAMRAGYAAMLSAHSIQSGAEGGAS